jgi:toxin ParE1/3/4
LTSVSRFRFSRSAQTDLAHILDVSAERWGDPARQRYQALLVGAMEQLAADPDGPLTRNRSELRSGVRSFHVRHTRRDAVDERGRQPAHVIFYRARKAGIIEIVRILHERMDPVRHLNPVREPTED